MAIGKKKKEVILLQAHLSPSPPHPYLPPPYINGTLLFALAGSTLAQDVNQEVHNSSTLLLRILGWLEKSSDNHWTFELRFSS